jgi:hypothetical protein
MLSHRTNVEVKVNVAACLWPILWAVVTLVEFFFN